MLPAVFLVAIVLLGVLGRFVSGPDPAGGRAEVAREPGRSGAAGASQETGSRLTLPVADVLWLGATEIAARGEVPPGIAAVDARVVVSGELLGKATLAVDGSGRFEGVVAITPPATRTAARLEIRRTGLDGPPIAEVGFLVEAGSPVLIPNGSSLRAVVGETTIVDVLVYEPLHDLRALITSPGGTLIAEAAASPPRRDLRIGGPPVTVMLRIAIPADVRPMRARLHVLALDRPGHEVAHVDTNIRIEP